MLLLYSLFLLCFYFFELSGIINKVDGKQESAELRETRIYIWEHLASLYPISCFNTVMGKV